MINKVARNKKLWVFNGGDAFKGNPKWLFLYIVNYRKDITPVWLCYDIKTKDIITKLGYKACLFDSKEAQKIGEKAGVYVVDQYKEVIQEYLKGATILNLWHGVGCKKIEKGVGTGVLDQRIIKKHILNETIYRKYTLLLVTSPLMEKHFIKYCDVASDKIIRAGYPCCDYPNEIATFNHNILKEKGLPKDTKIAVYAPTYRENSLTNFFSTAIPDMEKLINVLKKNHYLLIFKMHPLMKNDFQYQNMYNAYKDNPNLLFWDNDYDFYEVMDQVDLAIVDYSSIFYDMLARGIKHFARYIFDYDNPESVRDFAFDYMEMSCGTVCKDFNSFLNIFSEKLKDESQELERIKNLFWAYAKGKESFDIIINRALSFEPDENYTLPDLYSFDIFDTLIGRTTLKPEGIFKYVQEKMIASEETFPYYLSMNFSKVRKHAEADCREYYKKSTIARGTDTIEISLDMIYEHIRKIYNLKDDQIRNMKNWELEAEYKSSIPYKENIEKVKQLKAEGKDVVLISDMYLPIDFVRKLLVKADPIFQKLPIFLSSELGVQKATKKLFYKVYHSLNYCYGNWYHFGDNLRADGSIPRSLGIQTINHDVIKYGAYEEELVDFVDSYDAYQVAALLAKFKAEDHTSAEKYAYGYVSLYWVPYIYWALTHAMKHGIKCVYFISRDGHFLKQIADVLIQEKGWKIRTKYIYGSRKAWRIPSQIHEIDDDFFSGHGNFVDIHSFDQLLEAADISESDFIEIMPELAYLKKQQKIGEKELKLIRDALGASERYRAYILRKASEERKVVLKYLKQEINFNEKFAFIEYWARGYTQTCLARLLQEISGKVEDNIFYYARSIYPSEGHMIRYNFTTNKSSLIFIESLFANLPYQSIKKYELKDDKVQPIIEKNTAVNKDLFNAFGDYLQRFSKDYANIDFLNADSTSRWLFDFFVILFL